MVKSIKHFIRLAILYTQTRVLNLRYKAPEVIDDLTTLELLRKERKSISRFGDGEIDLINQKSIKFQTMDENLSRRLREVMESDRESLLVAIPNIFTLKAMKQLTFESKLFWQHQLIDCKEVWYSVPKNKKYYDACFTRPYIRNKDKNHSRKLFEELRKIWEDRDVVIIEGVYSRLGVGNDLFDNTRSLRRILCPAQNAYARYNDILECAMQIEKDSLFLISLGPTATVLAYDLDEKGYQAIDLGHIDLEYEWFLRGSEGRVPLDNKVVNELDEQGDLSMDVDSKYENQIFGRVYE